MKTLEQAQSDHYRTLPLNPGTLEIWVRTDRERFLLRFLWWPECDNRTVDNLPMPENMLFSSVLCSLRYWDATVESVSIRTGEVRPCPSH